MRSVKTGFPYCSRQKLAGIKTTGQGQVVYVDTPGIHHSAKRALNRYMNRVAQASFRDVDMVMFLVEAGNWTRQDEFVAKGLACVDVPVMLVLNKVDLVPDKASLLEFVDKNFRDNNYDSIMMISEKTAVASKNSKTKSCRNCPLHALSLPRTNLPTVVRGSSLRR